MELNERKKSICWIVKAAPSFFCRDLLRRRTAAKRHKISGENIRNPMKVRLKIKSPRRKCLISRISLIGPFDNWENRFFWFLLIRNRESLSRKLEFFISRRDVAFSSWVYHFGTLDGRNRRSRTSNIEFSPRSWPGKSSRRSISRRHSSMHRIVHELSNRFRFSFFVEEIAVEPKFFSVRQHRTNLQRLSWSTKRTHQENLDTFAQSRFEKKKTNFFIENRRKLFFRLRTSVNKNWAISSRKNFSQHTKPSTKPFDSSK